MRPFNTLRQAQGERLIENFYIQFNFLTQILNRKKDSKATL